MPLAKTDLSFWGHLEDLRGRVLKCLAVYVLACAGFYPCAPSVLAFVTAPAGPLVFTSPPDAFMAYWNVVLWGGFVVALPYFFYHFWSFVGEGLRPGERKVLLFYGPLSLILFGVGGVFAFWIVLPMSYQFFMGYALPGIRPLITLDRYAAYAAGVVLSFAAAFELPFVLFILARLGVVNARGLAATRRHAIVAILVVAAILTPPDVASQIMLALPLLVLYEAGIVLARMGERKSRAGL